MSDENRQEDLEARVARLEQLVADLLTGKGRDPDTPPMGPAPEPPWAGRRPPTLSDVLDRSESGEGRSRAARSGSDLHAARAFALDTEKWLGRAGIGFVILAFAFLLKLSFDRGWITPALRLGAGGAAGMALLAVGLLLENSRRTLAQALLAGAIGLFYLVTWAGAELYGFFPLWLALSLMSTTTLLAFVLAQRQDSPALGVMAVGGGLATPWLVQLGAASEPGLASYLTVVLLGGAAIFVLRGWAVIIATMIVGGWVSAGSHVLQIGYPGFMTLLMVGTYWAATVGVPLVRSLLTGTRGDPIPIRILRATNLWGSAATVLMLGAALELERVGMGGLFLGLAVFFTAAAILVREVRASFVAALEAVAVSVAVGLTLVTWGTVSPLLLMVEAALLLEIRSRGGPGSFGPIAHALSLVAAGTFLVQSLLVEPPGPLALHRGALPHLGVILVAAAASMRAGRAASFYRAGAYMGLLVWFLAEFAPRSNGQALVSIAWAVQGALALAVSRVSRDQGVQMAGLGTLALVAAKLLLLDLSMLDPVWRILLFLGFGATLLGLGYWLNSPEREAERGSGAAG